MTRQETKIKRIKHPKGFCYICGKTQSTSHHLKEQEVNRKGKLITRKVNGIIPLCRDCHDYVEELKCEKNAYIRGCIFTNAKWKEAVQKLKEEMFSIASAKERVVLESDINRIFGELI